jgi:carbonic anhydrase
VEGAIKALQTGTAYPGAIEDIIKAIQPSVEKVKGEPGNLLQNAVLENVRLGISKLHNLDPVIAPMVKEGKVKVVGGNYDLVSGEVTLVV